MIARVGSSGEAISSTSTVLRPSPGRSISSSTRVARLVAGELGDEVVDGRQRDAVGGEQRVALVEDLVGRRIPGALVRPLLEAHEVVDDDVAGQDPGVLVAERPQRDVLGDLRRRAHHLQARSAGARSGSRGRTSPPG